MKQQNKAASIMMLGMILIIMMMVSYQSFHQNKVGESKGIYEVQAEVLEVDDSEIVRTNIAAIGSQQLTVKILKGKYKGKVVPANNGLLGQLDVDNIYQKGDHIVVAVMEKEEEIVGAKALDYYRQNGLLILFVLFILILLIYGGIIGIKALFSFVASLVVIWYFLIPRLLAGDNAIVMAVSVVVLLSAIIIFSVAGFTKKAVAAFAGTVFGLLITILLTIFIGNQLFLDGMTAPFAPTLLFSGHMDLNMLYIFYAAIIIGASGAGMDIAMDIASAMDEIKNKKPDISRRELIESGFTVGKSVIGTMTTTLLLAYSGSYLTLLMVFMSKQSSFIRIINLKMVSAEIMRTLIGSIGIVLIAPITAMIAGYILTKENK